MPRKLPSELEDEILFRVPPPSLTRFRTVCKRWNSFFHDEIFVNNHLACVRPQFILRTENSKIYSIGINLDDSLEVRELNLEPKGPKKLELYRNLVYCDGFLLCPALKNEVAIWNPWLRQQTKWIKPKRSRFDLYGLGYDNGGPDKGYKILGFSYCYIVDYESSFSTIHSRVSIYEFATNAWKDLESDSLDWDLCSPRTVLSLNGTLYWIALRSESDVDYFIQSFDFSRERFEPICILPCKSDFGDTQVLEAFRGDRLSLLEQCKTTKKINIWVTNDRITGNGKEHVSWGLLMTVSIPNFPMFQDNVYSKSQPSYFIDNNDDKRLIVCTCDETGKPCIYIVKGDKFKKIQMGVEIDPWPFHLVYVPSLVSIPQEQQE